MLASLILSLVLSLNPTAGKKLEWQVGDQNNYAIEIGGFIKGSLVMNVHSMEGDALWVHQNMDLGFAGKQKIESLIDIVTGETLRVIVNGREQPPSSSESEVLEAKEEQVTVPAGTFPCIYARLKDKQSNQESRVWINPAAIPMSGLLKSVQPTSMGTAVIQLTQFRRGG